MTLFLNLLPLLFILCVFGLMLLAKTWKTRWIIMGVAFVLALLFKFTQPMQPKNVVERDLHRFRDVPAQQDVTQAPLENRLRAPERTTDQYLENQYDKYENGLPWREGQ